MKDVEDHCQVFPFISDLQENYRQALSQRVV